MAREDAFIAHPGFIKPSAEEGFIKPSARHIILFASTAKVKMELQMIKRDCRNKNLDSTGIREEFRAISENEEHQGFTSEIDTSHMEICFGMLSLFFASGVILPMKKAGCLGRLSDAVSFLTMDTTSDMNVHHGALHWVAYLRMSIIQQLVSYCESSIDEVEDLGKFINFIASGFGMGSDPP